MALQPAAGARDLNPREVEHNRWICTQLAGVYRLWGYQEVAPPHFEHLSTLEAGGGIDGRELVRLAADEPLGLRPELTASIARAACTRLASRPRPLRLWAEGPTYRTQIADGGQQRIVEELQSGVELLGEASAAADAELLRLLLAASAAVGLGPAHRPRLLLGHHALLAGLLGQLPEAQQPAARAALTSFDPLALSQLPLPETERQRLSALMRLRGEPLRVLYQLEQWLGPLPPLTQLADTLALIAGSAERLGVVVQLDPTFQPHFALYDGLVLKLVCQGATAPLEVASGGRYDALVGRFWGQPQPESQQAAGMGFGFDVAALRELLAPAQHGAGATRPTLVAMAEPDLLRRALDELEALHRAGQAAELHGSPLPSAEEAERIAAERGCSRALWLAA
jgi:ATP phosphoribosyltransferase regulatory subunit